MKDHVRNARPSSWRKATLGEIYEIGSSKRVLQKQWKTSGVPFYRAREVVKLARNGCVENVLFISEAHFSELKESHGVPQPGDLMVSAVGTLGACYAVKPGDRFYFKDASVLWFRPKAPVDPRFMQYAFLSDDLLGRVKASEGATVGTLTISRAKAMELLLPPLEEQKRIVAVLDQAFAALDRARAHAAANLADAQHMRAAYITRCIEKTRQIETTQLRLGDLCTIARGGSPRPIQKYLTSSPEGVNWIKISDASASGQFIEETRDKIVPEGVFRSRYVKAGSFLLTNSMSFGRPYILRTDGCIHDGWLVLEPDYSKVDQDFLYFLLGSSQVYGEFNRLAAGSTVRNLNISLVSNVVVNLPDLDTQKEVVRGIFDHSAMAQELERLYEIQLAGIADVRQSLLHRAFSGQLTA